MASKLIRQPDVTARTGIPRSTLYLRIRQGTFPKPISLGERSVAWIETEINEWVDRQIERSRESCDETLGGQG